MKKYIDEAFEKLTPVRSDEEIFSRVLRRAENLNSSKKRKRISLKKTAVAICAALGTVTLGITGAAAVGVIDFDTLFGRFITAESGELGENLLCRAENFNYTVSDSNYKIELNGITGSAADVLVNLEISRTDGTPVIDSFVNPYDPRYGVDGHDDSCVYPDKAIDYTHNIGGGGSYTVNDEGNVEAVFSLGSTELNSYPLKDKKIRIEGAKIYPIEPYFDHIDPLCNGTRVENGKVLYFKNNQYVPVDTSSVHYLDLSWTAEFEYVPSEIALETIRKGYYALDDVKLMVAYADEGISEQKVEFHGMELTSTHMTIEGKLPSGDLCFADNEIYLIKKNGDRIRMIMKSGSQDGHGKFSYTLRYCTGYKENADGSFFADFIAVDLTQVKAVEINGTVYKL